MGFGRDVAGRLKVGSAVAVSRSLRGIAVAATVGLVLCTPALALGGTGAISGKVTGPEGKPLPPKTQVGVSISTERDGLGGDGYTVEGEYTLSGVATGTYLVRFTAPGYITQYYDGASLDAYATPVTVTSGKTNTGINAELQPAATISGKVTNSDDVPLAKIRVSVEGSAGAYGTAETNQSGEYTVGGLAAGAYKVTFAPAQPVAGFSRGGGNYLQQYYDDRSSGQQAEALTLAAGEKRENIDASLPAGATISGQIVDQSGTPVEGLLVSAYTPDGSSAGSWYTEADGRYSIDQLRGGSYAIGVGPAEAHGSQNYMPEFYAGRSTLAGASAVKVSPGGEAEVDTTVIAGGQITGRVTGPNDVGVPQARVTLLSEAREYVGEVQTQSDGTYSIGALESGDYFVEFMPPFSAFPGLVGSSGNFLESFFDGEGSLENANLVSVVAGATTSEVDGRLGEGGEIVGTVTTPGEKPAPNITVDAYDAAGTWVASALTGSTGEYTIGGLTSGSYRLEFSAEQQIFGTGPGNYAPLFSGGASSVETATGVAVTVGKAAPFDAKMQTGATISGVVTGRGGAGVGGVSVRASRGGPFAQSATTSLNGAYTITGLAAGAYTIEVQDGASGSDELDYAPLTDAATATVTPGGETTGIDVQLTTGGSIAGTVTDSSGAGPAEFVVVSIHGENGQSVRSSPLFDGEWGYSIGALAPGKYTVCFEGNTGSPDVGYVSDCIGGSSPSTATPFTVTSGEVTSVPAAKLTLNPGSISGSVTDANGHGVPARVSIYEAGGANVIASASTAADGSYTVSGLAPGFYRVGFAPDSGTGGFYGGASALEQAAAILVVTGTIAEGIDYQLPSHGSPAITSTTSTTTSTTSLSAGHVAVEAKPLTEAEKRAKAIAACAKLRKSKRAKCVAAAKKRFPLKAAKPKPKPKPKAKGRAKT